MIDTRTEDVLWDIEREQKRRGVFQPAPPNKRRGMQADWAEDAMRKAREARDA